MFTPDFNFVRYIQLAAKNDLFDDSFAYLLMQECNFYKVVPTTQFIVFLWEWLMAAITGFTFELSDQIYRRVGSPCITHERYSLVYRYGGDRRM
jgi:hypothetical protein